MEFALFKNHEWIFCVISLVTQFNHRYCTLVTKSLITIIYIILLHIWILFINFQYIINNFQFNIIMIFVQFRNHYGNILYNFGCYTISLQILCDSYQRCCINCLKRLVTSCVSISDLWNFISYMNSN